MKWPWQKQKTIKEFSDYEIENEYREREAQIRENDKRRSVAKFAQDMVSAVERDPYAVEVEICRERTTPSTSAFLVTFRVRRQEI